MTAEPQHYGATHGEAEAAAAGKPETFSISEPYASLHDVATPLRPSAKARASCCRGESRALNVIILSMFVFAAGVTIALVVQIATGEGAHLVATNQVASDHGKCTEIGDRILKEGGNAVDAAIAATFCLAVVSPHVTGLGGGGVMLVHKRRENKTAVIDFREAAPRRSGQNSSASAQTGRDSIAIPGFLKGLEYAFDNFGSHNPDCCSWSKLIYPAISLSREITAGDNLVNATHTKLKQSELTDPLSKFIKEFVYGTDGRPLDVNTVLKDIPMYKAMVKNLETIVAEGSLAFYNGTIANQLVEELEGILTHEDLRAYKVEEREMIQTTVGDFHVLASPAPTSGPKLLAFLNAMNDLTEKHGIPTVNAQYLTDVSKLLWKAERLQMSLGDPTNNTEVSKKTAFMLDKQNAKKQLNTVGGGESLGFEGANPAARDPVSANVNVMDKEDIYVSVATSLNTWFGSKVMTSSGILLNNAMGNFASASDDSLDGAEVTQNRPGFLRRPLTPAVVALAIDAKKMCGQRLLVGGSTADSVGEVLVDALLYKLDLKSSVDRGRLRVLRDSVSVEMALDGFREQVVDEFKSQGANVTFVELPYTTVNGVDKTIDTVLPYEDLRSGGHRAAHGAEGPGVSRLA